MQEKITLYQEMLKLEPGSKLFFPLAEMLVAAEEYGNAEEVLTKGLAIHPEFMEARLLLVDVLDKLGQDERVLDETRHVIQMLNAHQGFWKSWETLLARENDMDSLLALRFLTSGLQGTPLRWMDVFAKGCEQVVTQASHTESVETVSVTKSEDMESMVAEELDASLYEEEGESGLSEAPIHEDIEAAGDTPLASLEETDKLDGLEEQPATDQDADEVADISLDPDVSTRTMADLLVEQEEYEQALAVYQRLLETCEDASDRQHIMETIEKVQGQMAVPEHEVVEPASSDEEGDVQEGERDEMVKTLSSLADRLDERARK
ncbi:MAG: hypothetical protein CSA21_04420 [Deltaproteobacteria bacterium]|nr:MAG: hypothetical protein CSA21_04420 [Deltaproteobacteria bacterium]